jgi:RNA polymerase sigma factor (sigma-70 family)
VKRILSSLVIGYLVLALVSKAREAAGLLSCDCPPSRGETRLWRPKRDGELAHLEDVGTMRGSGMAVRVSVEHPSLEELYERHVTGAIRLATLLTGDPAAAEDLAHEGFIRSAGMFRHLRTPASFDAYLKKTVVNLSRQRFRRQRLEREAARREGDREPMARAAYSPEDRNVVWPAILRLPFRQRAAIVLRYYEDLSEDQTAEVLRCTTRAANSLVSRAMTTLRRDLAKEET